MTRCPSPACRHAATEGPLSCVSGTTPPTADTLPSGPPQAWRHGTPPGGSRPARSQHRISAAVAFRCLGWGWGGVHGDPHRGALRNGPGQSLPQPPACTAPARRARHRLPGMHRARRPFPAPSMHRARGDRPSTAFPACTAGDKSEGWAAGHAGKCSLRGGGKEGAR